jgi:hypothetical protein
MPTNNQLPSSESGRIKQARRIVSDLAAEVFVALLILFFGLAVPAGAVAQTLTGRTNIILRTGLANNIPVALFALLATVALIWWLAVGYRTTDRISRHLVFLMAAISVNIYLGFTVWVVITKFVGSTASPHRLGLMVWWNLSDSIPFVNVNSALDWEQPLNEYGAGTGWLFLLQRIVLILTLVRIVQVLINKWMSLSRLKPEAPAATPDASSQSASRTTP